MSFKSTNVFWVTTISKRINLQIERLTPYRGFLFPESSHFLAARAESSHHEIRQKSHFPTASLAISVETFA